MGLKSLNNNIHKYLYLALFWIPIFIIGCSDFDEGKDLIEDKDINIGFRVRSINEDNEYYEDRVNSVRVIIAESETGNVIYNDMLRFPSDDFTKTSNSIFIKRKAYDYYFIANETTGGQDFVTALKAVPNTSVFYTDNRFWNLRYSSDFKPNLNQGFLMSARYKGVTIAKGAYSEDDPWIFNKNGVPQDKNFKVGLIRALAKINIEFKGFFNDEPLNSQYTLKKAIQEVSITNIPKYYSVPPIDKNYTELFPGTSELTNITIIDFSSFNYSNKDVGSLTYYIPEFLITKSAISATPTTIKVKMKRPSGEIKELIATFDNDDFSGYDQQDLRDVVPGNLNAKTTLRNTKYNFQFNLKEQEIILEVQPWEDKTISTDIYGNFLSLPKQIELEQTAQVVDYKVYYYSSVPVTRLDVSNINDFAWVKSITLYPDPAKGNKEGYMTIRYQSNQKQSTPFKVALRQNISPDHGNITKTISFIVK